jgi:peroxiredoxin
MTEWPYPAPPDCGGARHLVTGLEIPDLALPSTAGGATSLARVPGLCVVFVYPWTGRPGLPDPPDWDRIPGAHGSTPEAAAFRDCYPAFRTLGAEIFGLSAQGTEHQQEFARRLALPFALLSDQGLVFQKALALPVFETGGTTYLKRLTLVARDGRLCTAIFPVHPPDTHAAAVLASIRNGEAATFGVS